MATRDAVIVSTARTPIGKAYRGAFNATPSPTLAAHAIRAAVERSGMSIGSGSSAERASRRASLRLSASGGSEKMSPCSSTKLKST